MDDGGRIGDDSRVWHLDDMSGRAAVDKDVFLLRGRLCSTVDDLQAQMQSEVL